MMKFMKATKNILLPLLSLAMLAGLFGCLGERKKADFTGIWEESCTELAEEKICGELELFENGKFTARSVPGEYFSISTKERIDIKGTWELNMSQKDPFSQDIMFYTDKVDFLARISTLDNPFALFVGSDDDPIIFRKVDGDIGTEK